jgi:D12 class N6 adenine-specific DNA methyltransferase
VTLRAPFPWFGGKSRVAHLVWERFGNVPNYVEPFAGSLAVMLGRPHDPGTETVNDRDAYISNFWRAIQADPEEVARFADWPVSEADLHARHRWLVLQHGFRERMLSEPDYFDAVVAGWWVWGVCQWIGSGWCTHPEWMGRAATSGEMTYRGIHSRTATAAPGQRGDGPAPSRQLPHLGNAGMGILLWFSALSERLRRVRIACGEWDRVLGPSVTEKHGVTGVFLDPPYSSDEHSVDYAVSGDVAGAVREWAIGNGENPNLRIALCGYEGEHQMPATWPMLAWKARGGYGSQGNGAGRENAARERIWFSPHCLTGGLDVLPLFAEAGR